MLTAAHCVVNDRRYIAHVGRHDLSLDESTQGADAIETLGSVTHPLWNPATFEYDLAVITLARPTTLTPAVADLTPDAGERRASCQSRIGRDTAHNRRLGCRGGERRCILRAPPGDRSRRAV